MFSGPVSLILLFCYGFASVRSERWGLLKVENLVKQWAPLIWLSPEEKFMPSNVEEFLENMNIADDQGNIVTFSKHSARFFQYNSKSFFLVPNKPLDSLKSNVSSFLYGKTLKNSLPVPIYAVVTYCIPSPYKETYAWDNDEIVPHFHVMYWTFYPYNEGKDACFLGKVPAPLIFSKCLGHYRKLGNHIGDWEHMSLFFSGNPYPDQLFLSVHDAGAYYRYNRDTNIFKYEANMPRKGVAQVPKYPEFIRLQGGHPVLFAAQGSHGLWSTPGDHDFIRMPKISDRTGFGIPWKTWAFVKFYHIGQTDIPSWMNFKGKWGNPKTKCVLLKKFGLCEYTEGPKGLLRENQDFYC